MIDIPRVRGSARGDEMKEYDVVVIGAGDVGLGIVFKAAARGGKVALIEKGNVGGTCINVGCVPSKTLLFPADRIMEIRESEKLGIKAKITDIDFPFIMRRMKETVRSSRKGIRSAIKDTSNIDFLENEAHFTGDHALEAGGKKIKGKQIFIASGARPFIPPIKGLAGIPYLTNESVLKIERRPDSLIVIGGGFIAVEYAHFFSAMGTRVIMVDRGSRLLASEEPEISGLMETEMGKRMDIRTATEAVEVFPRGGGYGVRLRKRGDGEETELLAEQIMVAAGRRSNADLLKVANAGVATDERNFIKVNSYLETSRKSIWALGDAIGKGMFTHAGDKEAEVAWHNATHKKKIKMDFSAIPHAVFSYPQVASIGLTEEEARKKHHVLVGRAKYSDTVKGTAMGEEQGFAKAIVEKRSKRILGFHIIGPDASVLIQEVVNAYANKSDVTSITNSMHIFPALSDIITETFNNLE